MAIQYAGGTNVSYSWTPTTRLQIVSNMETQLVNAGWSVITGAGTANVLLQSATTPSPQSLDCQVRLTDPGSGNCATIQFQNVAGTRAHSNKLFLYPEAAKPFRIVANKYQFFVFSQTTAARNYAAGGVPFLPAFLQGVITECIWAQGDGSSDSSTGTVYSFRKCLHTGINGVSNSAIWQTVNSVQWEVNAGSWASYETRYSGQQLMGLGSGILVLSGYKWHDGSYYIYEPIVGWGTTGVSDEVRWRGQIWDAAVVSGSFTGDQVTTFDSKNWIVLTTLNTGVNSSEQGSLLLLVP